MDAPLVEFIQRFQSASVNRIMIFFSEINNIGLIWIILSLILILKNETRHLGIIILLSLIVTSILGEGILKNIITNYGDCFKLLYELPVCLQKDYGPKLKKIIHKLNSQTYNRHMEEESKTE